MAKRMTLIAPVESLSGNLSGAQDLKYADNMNPAFEAPEGRNYAKNYTPRYIGVQRADGSISFAVKRKSATTINTTTQRQMALIGAVRAIISALDTLGSGAILRANYAFEAQHGSADYLKSYNAYMYFNLKPLLIYGQTSITLSGTTGAVTIYNPFSLTKIQTSHELVININTFKKFLVQFALWQGSLLATSGYIKVDGYQIYLPAVTANGDNLQWSDLIGSTSLSTNMATNLQGLTSTETSGGDVQYNGMYLLRNGEGVGYDDAIDITGTYTTSPVLPS